MMMMMMIIPNSQNLYCAITEKLQKYTELKEELTRVWQPKTAYIWVLSTTDITPNKLHESLRQLNLRPALYILMQKAVILNTWPTVRKVLVEQ